MSEEKVFQMDFGKIYGLLLNKAVKKGRTKAEVDQVISWLTGYDEKEIEDCRATSVCYGDFFLKAPSQTRPDCWSPVPSAACGWRKSKTLSCGTSAVWTS